jgi:hypothetical protein
MRFLILFFPSLLLHVFRDALLIAKLPNRVDEIPLRPKLPAPKGLLYRRHTHEDFSGRYALDRLNNLLRARHRNRLNQKMNVIHIRSYLQKPYFVTLRYLQAYFTQLLNLPHPQTPRADTSLDIPDDTIKPIHYDSYEYIRSHRQYLIQIYSKQTSGNITRRDSIQFNLKEAIKCEKNWTVNGSIF